MGIPGGFLSGDPQVHFSHPLIAPRPRLGPAKPKIIHPLLAWAGKKLQTPSKNEQNQKTKKKKQNKPRTVKWGISMGSTIMKGCLKKWNRNPPNCWLKSRGEFPEVLDGPVQPPTSDTHWVLVSRRVAIGVPLSRDKGP